MRFREQLNYMCMYPIREVDHHIDSTWYIVVMTGFTGCSVISNREFCGSRFIKSKDEKGTSRSQDRAGVYVQRLCHAHFHATYKTSIKLIQIWIQLRTTDRSLF